ncbi:MULTISPECIES: GspE/PulE family protein [Methylobacterium]|uniref:GspE/PulE family protein n=1 Tax=Methylobacterium TaxID=407 RepID=UPI001046D17B|nr:MULTISPECIES: GspE/PulE family protein [Methylobacterium]MDR7039561.1 general secretion pathway protein E [Methylobacterium sp. BE186]
MEQVRSSLRGLDPASPAFAERFGAFLAEEGLLDRAAVERARRAATLSGDRFDAVLTKLGILSEPALAAGLSRFLGLPLHVPGEGAPERLLPDALPARFVTENRVLPVRLEGGVLTLAVVDPFDRMPLESVGLVVEEPVRVEIIAPADFERLAAQLYADRSAAGAAGTGLEADHSDTDLQRLRDSASEAPVIRLLDQIIAGGVEAGASDIYIEPTTASLRVRYRVDGVLRVVEEAPARLSAAVASRVKILARLDIAERRLPQDGRIKIPVRGHEVDFRVATIPTIDGEAVTMRVLDRSRVTLDFASLGFERGQIETLTQLAAQPNGIILVTGPTGSGKTTTLYTMLRQVNRPTAKIFTVEDPIEYQLSGISQVQTQEGIGLDFPAILRSILRHHPDMIMIGEIRDEETARIAVQASLTGHLVFSTLHTNSAAETITRLIDMGIEHFLLGSTVRGIVAQRLVRRLCPACAAPHPDAPVLAAHLPDRVPALRGAGAPDLRRPVGCEACQGSGYAGQLSIAELMPVDSRLRDAVLRRASGTEIEALARAGGVRSLYEDGIVKAWQGLTAVEEVLRVTSGIEAPPA